MLIILQAKPKLGTYFLNIDDLAYQRASLIEIPIKKMKLKARLIGQYK